MIEYPRHYFEDEVREGFYITGMMKRVWAAQFGVLEEIDKVCRRHNLKWFADCGTLLGAVRHGGFIPWDDDLDICMLRDDYEKFIQYAPSELPPSFYVATMHDRDVLYLYISRVTNEHSITFSDEFLNKYYDCYLPMGIDLFPLDYLIPNEKDEDERHDAARELFILSDYVTKKDEENPEYWKAIEDVEKLLGIRFDRNHTFRQLLYEATEAMFKVWNSKNATEVALMPFWVKNKSHRYQMKSFRESVMVPFECGEIPVPIEYDNVLKVEYGDYMRLVKAGGIHEYPFFEKMEDILIEEVSNYTLRYEFDPKHLENPERDQVDHIKKQVATYLETVKEAHSAVVLMLAQANGEVLFALLEKCQEGAINIGTLLEKVYGEGFSAVGALEEYCESIYQLSTAISSGEFTSQDSEGVAFFLNDLLNNMTQVLTKEVIERKEMVFIPYRADYWDGMKSMWKKAKEEGVYHVYVAPIPYYKKNARTILTDQYYEGDEFPAEAEIIDYKSYDFKLRHPDVIVTQQPFDECNHTMSVGPEHFSKNLKKYTEELVYVTPFLLDEIEDKNGKAWKTMDYFCAVPGVVHADRVVVQSEKMRQAYIDRLTDMGGEETRSIWEAKIDGSGIPLADAIAEREADLLKRDKMEKVPEDWKKLIQKEDGTLKKILLYSVGVASLAQNGDQTIKKIESVLNTLKENKGEIALIWHANPHIRKTMKKVDLATRDKFVKLLENYLQEGWGIYTDTADVNDLINLSDAFYGDSGTLAHKMRLLKKPVMLQNVEIL